MESTSKVAREMPGGGAFVKESVEALYQHPQVVATYDQDRFSDFKGRVKFHVQLSAVMDLLEVSPGSRVLDLATGTGRFALELARAFPYGGVVGADLSFPMLRRVQEKLHGKSGDMGLIAADAFRMPLPDSAFDNIVTFLFLQHFDGPCRQELYAEIRRLLRPNGVLVMNALNYHYHKDLIETRPVYDVIYRQEELIAELRGVGFRVEAILGAPLHAWHLDCLLRPFRRLSLIRRSEPAQVRIALLLTRLLRCRKKYVTAAPEWIVKCRNPGFSS
jgi:ubiquinone/menaquinone biosynthesis C-methylase UbiE